MAILSIISQTLPASSEALPRPTEALPTKCCCSSHQECTAAGDGGASPTTKVYEFCFFLPPKYTNFGFFTTKMYEFWFFLRKCTNIGASGDVPDVPRRTSVSMDVVVVVVVVVAI